MRDGNIKCPKCNSNVKPITCGLYDCEWKFEGVKSIDGLSISSPWKSVEGETYHRFDADEHYGSVKWASLLIMVKPRPGATASSRGLCFEQTQEGMCTICWAEVGTSIPALSSSATTSICGHRFHNVCIGKWARHCNGHHTVPTCPQCRQTM